MKHLLLPIFLCLAGFLSAQDYNALIANAEKHYNDKAYPQSVAQYKAAFKIEKKDPGDLYNAACSAALSGKKGQALKWLDMAQKNGWANARHAKSDTDLNALHGSKKWTAIVANMQTELNKREANYDKPLQAELLAILEDDQNIRRQFVEAEKQYGFKDPRTDSLLQIMIANDKINLKKVTAILDQHGWVGPDKVGGQANQALFLVIQHSELAIQQKYLPMMREAVQMKKASGSSLALLEDRVALGEGRKQTYGSQIGFDESSGKYYVLPLEDPDKVDQRRASVGLGPLADYVKRWDVIWDVEAYKKQLPEIEALQKKSGQ